MRLWIDTDIGDNPDDAVALACAAAHPDVAVVGVSVVGERRAERAALARSFVDAPVHESRGNALAARFAEARPDALLAIGALTNVADVVRGLGEEASSLVRGLTLMGGVIESVRHRGAVRAIEHNFGADAAAAAAVLSSVPATIVPLDVTVAMRVSTPDLDRLVVAVPGLSEEVQRWLPAQRDAAVPAAERAVVLHDPLALLVCARDAASGVRVETRGIAVDTRGAVIVDEGRTHDVVVGVDAPSSMQRVLALLDA